MGLPVVIDLAAGPDGGSRGVRRLRGCGPPLGIRWREGVPKPNRDPFPLSRRWFLVAGADGLYLADDLADRTQQIVSNAALRGESPCATVGGLACHEPRALRPRPREPVLADVTDPKAATGRLVIQDV
jgi:hypothetical protein